jgi:hypothetical protein
MAIALQTSNNILLSQNSHLLNFWPDTMLESIWLFNQCAGKGAPIQTASDKGKVYLQKEREYIARELEKAYIKMSNDLNYFLTPAYYSEVIPVGLGRPVANQILQGRYCKMSMLGSRATALISANAPVVYSDPNNSGVQDTATVTVVTGVANAEVKLFFRVTDGAQGAGDYRYEIYPTQVTDSAGTVTIKAHRALFVKPSEWAREYKINDPNFNSPNIVDTSDVNAFVSAVDVYRVYTDQTSAIQLLDSNLTVLQTYSGYLLNPELSAFRLGYLCSNVCGGYPTFIRVSYLSGSPLINGYPDSELYESCVALACSNMETDMGEMSYWNLNQYLRWHGALMESSRASQIPVATQRQSNGLYGARAGQILASDTVMSRRVEKGHKFL